MNAWQSQRDNDPARRALELICNPGVLDENPYNYGSAGQFREFLDKAAYAMETYVRLIDREAQELTLHNVRTCLFQVAGKLCVIDQIYPQRFRPSPLTDEFMTELHDLLDQLARVFQQTTREALRDYVTQPAPNRTLRSAC